MRRRSGSQRLGMEPQMKTVVVVWQAPPVACGGEFVPFDDRTFDALRDRTQSVGDGAAATVAEVAPAVEAG